MSLADRHLSHRLAAKYGTGGRLGWQSARSDILENLGHLHYDSPAYQLFKELLYDGGDPMEFRDYLIKVQKACKGEWPCWH